MWELQEQVLKQEADGDGNLLIAPARDPDLSVRDTLFALNIPGHSFRWPPCIWQNLVSRGHEEWAVLSGQQEFFNPIGNKLIVWLAVQHEKCVGSKGYRDQWATLFINVVCDDANSLFSDIAETGGRCTFQGRGHEADDIVLNSRQFQCTKPTLDQLAAMVYREARSIYASDACGLDPAFIDDIQVPIFQASNFTEVFEQAMPFAKHAHALHQAAGRVELDAEANNNNNNRARGGLSIRDTMSGLYFHLSNLTGEEELRPMLVTQVMTTATDQTTATEKATVSGEAAASYSIRKNRAKHKKQKAKAKLKKQAALQMDMEEPTLDGGQSAGSKPSDGLANATEDATTSNPPTDGPTPVVADQQKEDADVAAIHRLIEKKAQELVAQEFASSDQPITPETSKDLLDLANKAASLVTRVDKALTPAAVTAQTDGEVEAAKEEVQSLPVEEAANEVTSSDEDKLDTAKCGDQVVADHLEPGVECVETVQVEDANADLQGRDTDSILHACEEAAQEVALTEKCQSTEGEEQIAEVEVETETIKDDKVNALLSSNDQDAEDVVSSGECEDKSKEHKDQDAEVGIELEPVARGRRARSQSVPANALCGDASWTARRREHQDDVVQPQGASQEACRLNPAANTFVPASMPAEERCWVDERSEYPKHGSANSTFVTEAAEYLRAVRTARQLAAWNSAFPGAARPSSRDLGWWAAYHMRYHPAGYPPSLEPVFRDQMAQARSAQTHGSQSSAAPNNVPRIDEYLPSFYRAALDGISDWLQSPPRQPSGSTAPRRD